MVNLLDVVKEGQLVQYRVREAPALVLSVKKGGVVLLRPNGEIDVIEDSLWGSIKGYQKVEVSLNEESGVSHLVVNERTLCGNRWNVGSTVTVDRITCKKCKRMTS